MASVLNLPELISKVLQNVLNTQGFVELWRLRPTNHIWNATIIDIVHQQLLSKFTFTLILKDEWNGVMTMPLQIHKLSQDGTFHLKTPESHFLTLHLCGVNVDQRDDPTGRKFFLPLIHDRSFCSIDQGGFLKLINEVAVVFMNYKQGLELRELRIPQNRLLRLIDDLYMTMLEYKSITNNLETHNVVKEC
ncbi:hypothetical protein G9A89_023001 [Geosiphon pyriformis]|nr:hypothetical protein G9A89_023001 [Geosiphon pyriformis]